MQGSDWQTLVAMYGHVYALPYTLNRAFPVMVTSSDSHHRESEALQKSNNLLATESTQSWHGLAANPLQSGYAHHAQRRIRPRCRYLPCTAQDTRDRKSTRLNSSH